MTISCRSWPPCGGRCRCDAAAGWRARLRPAIAVSAHPLDDLSAYDDLGQTPQGIPVRVFQPVARANLRILVGSVLPHLQAGFGGGYKLIFPGTSHRTTLGSLHRQGLDGRSDPASLLGDHRGGNAMRQAIRAAASDWVRAGRSATLPAVEGRFFESSRDIPNTCRISWRKRQGDGFRHPRHRRRTWLWREMTPGRATRCRVSKCCFIIARLLGRAECSSACSGLTRTRSTARSRSMRFGVSPRPGGGVDGQFDGCCRWPANCRSRRIAGSLHVALGL